MNPSIDKDGPALNIGTTDNALSFELAKSVGEYFQLENRQMDVIIDEVLNVRNNWKKIATRAGIPAA